MSYQWQTIDIPCDNTCGQGLQDFRNVCLLDGIEVASSFCGNLPIEIKEPVNCVDYSFCENQWQAVNSACDTICGTGTNSVTYNCVTRDAVPKKVDDITTCSPEKPADSQETCEDSTGCKGLWEQLATCRTSCGPGVATSKVVCKSKTGPGLQDESECPEFEKPRPNPAVACAGSLCVAGFAWESIAETGTCEEGCGDSFSRLQRACFQNGVRVSNQLCIDQELDKEGDLFLEQLNCKSFSTCEYEVTTDECDARCGRGFIRKRAVCQASDTKVETILSDCDNLAFPDLEAEPCTGTFCQGKLCSLNECAWESVNPFCPQDICGTGRLNPDFKCRDFQTNLFIEDFKCSALQKPPFTSETCESFAGCALQWDFCCDDEKPIKLGCVQQVGTEKVPKNIAVCQDNDDVVEPVCDVDVENICPNTAGGIDSTLPIAASVGAIVFVGLLVGGVFLFLWNRKRLNKNAQETIAAPFAVVGSSNNIEMN